ncbi:hypothetical protein PBMFNG_PBMFNG_15540, partial [Dysosmobacter welbionis]
KPMEPKPLCGHGREGGAQACSGGPHAPPHTGGSQQQK